MKILVFVNKDSGPSYHRLIVPFMLLPEAQVYITNNIVEKQFEGIDLFIYNRILPDAASEKVYSLREHLGFKICVDIDDHWELDKDHILYHEYLAYNFIEKQISHLKKANFVITTHERLLAEILPINAACYIAENAIPHQGQFAEVVRTKSKLIRLFWQGSETHEHDIGLLSQCMHKLSDTTLPVRSVIAGYNDTPTWNRMAVMYNAFGKLKYSLIASLHISAYYKAYSEADICLVPLRDTFFNGMKSNLKILEAANLGLPAIVSNVHPYKDIPVVYADGTHEWYEQIRRLVKNKKDRLSASKKLSDYCKQHYDFTKINLKRRKLIAHETGK